MDELSGYALGLSYRVVQHLLVSGVQLLDRTLEGRRNSNLDCHHEENWYSVS
jgi:hypothetical protein